MSYGLSGSYAGEANKICFYFDQMELEKVDPDKVEGWDVWKGRISYPHTGYHTGAQKSAIASNFNAKGFKLIDQDNGKVMLTKPVQPCNSYSVSVQVIGSSEVRKHGAK